MRHCIAVFISALIASAALATPPKPCLYGGKKINALAQRADKDTSLTSEEKSSIESFKEDAETACSIRSKIWPVCIIGGGDMAPDCASLTAEELKAAPHEAEGARYSVSLEEAQELEKQRQALETKWADKNVAREIEQ